MSLIKSPKHTPSDLTVWKELEYADRSHGRSSRLRRNWDRALEHVRDFVADDHCHCSTSWGKDSVVTTAAVMAIAPETPVCWIRVEPVKSPECTLVRDAFLKKYPKTNYHEVEVQCSHDEFGFHATGTLERGISVLDEKFGSRTILGIRAQESSHRFLSIYASGQNTATKCRPCGHLTEKDIFGLLNLFDLPIHPAYAMTGGGRWPREHLRVSSLGGARGSMFGRHEWEQEYYGDELRRIGEWQIDMSK